MGGKPPKWMVKIMENPMKMDDLGGISPTIFGNTHIQPPPFSCEFIRGSKVGIPNPSSSPLPCDPRRSSNPAGMT